MSDKRKRKWHEMTTDEKMAHMDEVWDVYSVLREQSKPWDPELVAKMMEISRGVEIDLDQPLPDED